MAAPFKPVAAQEAIPNLGLPACSELDKALSSQPLLRSQLVSYLLKSDGTISATFAQDVCDALAKLGCVTTSTTTAP